MKSTSDQNAMLAVAAIALAAFALRVAVSYQAVFGQEYVAFIENDAWYHMRLVDALIREFPSRIWHDAYLLHPGGEGVNAGPMFDWIVAGAALLLGFGTPSPRLVDVVGAFTPPVLGALTIVPVYVLGRHLFSRRAGVWAAACAAVMPGALLQRSVLGFADHHCAEVLFSTLALMFVVLALDQTRPESKRTAFALGAGLSLGAYLLTWGGGALVVAMLVAWAGTEMVLSRARGDHGGAVVRLAALTLGVPALMITPWLGARAFFVYDMLALGGGIAGLLALHVLARATLRLQRGRMVYFAVTVVALAAALTIAVVASRSSLSGLFAEIGRFSPWRAPGYVTEAMPLMQSAAWRPIPLWREFTTSLVLGLLALPACILAAAAWRGAGMRLLLFWGFVSLAATFGQVRFAYYLAISVALLAGVGCDLLLKWIAREPAVGSARMTAWRAVVAVFLALAIGLPGAPALAGEGRLLSPINSDWADALQWMRTNTPEPFGDADAYYRSLVSAPSQYGVLAWWDYGYWVTRIARRVPVSNPRQSGVSDAAAFFLADEPAQAAQLLTQAGVRYVIVDAMLQAAPERAPRETYGFFGAIALAGDRPGTAYCDRFIPRGAGGDEPVVYCYPEYYRTMAVRLYAFGGKAVTPQSVWVIEAGDAVSGQPARVKAEWSFGTYEEARQFVQTRPAGQLRIVSKDLLSSCVPLAEADGYSPVYRSIGKQGPPTTGIRPSTVQIFEYRPRAAQSAATRPTARTAPMTTALRTEPANGATEAEGSAANRRPGAP